MITIDHLKEAMSHGVWDNREIKAVREIMNRNTQIFEEVQHLYSGGGCDHLFFRRNDGRIVAFHNAENDLEISYDAWGNIDDYIKASCESNTGFGYESDRPEYNHRAVCLTKVKTEEIHIKIFNIINYRFMSEQRKQELIRRMIELRNAHSILNKVWLELPAELDERMNESVGYPYHKCFNELEPDVWHWVSATAERLGVDLDEVELDDQLFKLKSSVEKLYVKADRDFSDIFDKHAHIMLVNETVFVAGDKASIIQNLEEVHEELVVINQELDEEEESAKLWTMMNYVQEVLYDQVTLILNNTGKDLANLTHDWNVIMPLINECHKMDGAEHSLLHDAVNAETAEAAFECVHIFAKDIMAQRVEKEKESKPNFPSFEDWYSTRVRMTREQYNLHYDASEPNSPVVVVFPGGYCIEEHYGQEYVLYMSNEQHSSDLKPLAKMLWEEFVKQ